jgi:hypothetical protein
MTVPEPTMLIHFINCFLPVIFDNIYKEEILKTGVIRRKP